MPFCPECRAEYRTGFDRCARCDVDLVSEDKLPEMLTDEEVIASMAEEDLLPIIRGSIEGCRETQRKLLEARIPAAIHEAQDVVAEAGHFRILQVVVRKEDAEQALQVLNLEWVEDAQREGLLEDLEISGPEGLDAVDGAAGEEEDDDEEPACPACGCTKPLKKGKCRDCGLHLA
jgi:hypothetical protein